MLTQNGTMNRLIRFVGIATVGVTCALASHAMEPCVQLPAPLQNLSVAQFTTSAELQSLDEQLEPYMQRCLVPVTAENAKSICTHGRLAAEQALRIIGRIDTAGRHSALLANAKLKSYKLAVALLERSKKLAADHACPP